MKKWTMVLMAVLLVLSVAAPSTASAEGVSGSGTIWANGAGQAMLSGHGEIRIHCHGAGIVLVKNVETLRAMGHGHKWQAAGGATVYWGWSGTIYASGQDITVWMSGGVIEFTASGTGKVYLQGRGKYRVNGSEGFWSPTGQILSLETVDEDQ